MRRQLRIQFNIDTVAIFGFDEATVPLQGTSDD
jgi:hypothetical protein